MTEDEIKAAFDDIRNAYDMASVWDNELALLDKLEAEMKRLRDELAWRDGRTEEERRWQQAEIDRLVTPPPSSRTSGSQSLD